MKEPTMEEVLELIDFGRDAKGKLFVLNVKDHVMGDVNCHVRGSVKGDVKGHVWGYVWGSVKGHIMGNVERNVWGGVWGTVKGTISGREWQFAETPKEKAIRLIREGKGEEAIDVLEISGVCGD